MCSNEKKPTRTDYSSLQTGLCHRLTIAAYRQGCVTGELWGLDRAFWQEQVSCSCMQHMRSEIYTSLCDTLWPVTDRQTLTSISRPRRASGSAWYARLVKRFQETAAVAFPKITSCKLRMLCG
ncbi:hypothetical protein RRG08_060921 [Elysia crispata]|uniref:Uncharacterized protein n=1 Tax=Elysia crispata TaxID=231223 RepID=A0AAE1D9H8_9GAST|nr:hypothetical protein RRG08_060921 [Elysia crispata]